jgi:hypothetical protein
MRMLNTGRAGAVAMALLAASCGGAIRSPVPTPPPSGGPARPRVVADDRLERAEASGTIRQIDQNGWLSIDSPLGLLRVLVADADQHGWQPGDEVRVRMAVQAVDVVPAGTPPERGSAEPDSPPDIGRNLGSYTATVGRVVDNDGGHITVESPRGDVRVWAPGRYRTGDLVQVWTWVERRTDRAR